MRLIDADALQAQIQQDYDLFAGSTYLPDKARRDELSNVIARIINAQTIETKPTKRKSTIGERIEKFGFYFFIISSAVILPPLIIYAIYLIGKEIMG